MHTLHGIIPVLGTMLKRLLSFAITFSLLTTASFSAAASVPGEFTTVSCAVHIHSTYSGKESSLEKIVDVARAYQWVREEAEPGFQRFCSAYMIALQERLYDAALK